MVMTDPLASPAPNDASRGRGWKRLPCGEALRGAFGYIRETLF
jgi:hypothetical protein